MCATCGCSAKASIHGHADHAHAHDHEHDAHTHEHHGHTHEHHSHTHERHSPTHDHGHTHEHHGHTHAHAHLTSVDPVETRRIKLEHDLLRKNDLLAAQNRGWLEARNVHALNLVSGPGAGKTSLLERIIRESKLRVSVIEGDQETERDAARVRAAGAKAIQINTGTGCHLDAEVVGRALRELDPTAGSVVCIENVGNLVCPALFDLGEHAKVTLLSVTEGDDKPLKYPHMFRASALLLITKIDLLPHVDFDVAACMKNARDVNPRLTILPISTKRGDGMTEFHAWLERESSKGVEGGGPR
jgi:hydrogenase nickel incorporation protein HypB